MRKETRLNRDSKVNDQVKLLFAFGLFMLSNFLCQGAFALPTSTYTNSAHGENTFGVKRDAPQLANASPGSCAHCHDVHGGALDGPSAYPIFAPTDPSSQTDNVCLRCHTDVNSAQVGGVVNHNYASTFGGGPPNTTSIAAAMNRAFPAGNSHNLGQISTIIQTRWPEVYDADSNPCMACHNQHKAAKNNGRGQEYDPARSAISLPSDHDNLWGDDADERMDISVGANTYRAPFSVGADPAVDPTLHEPDGLSHSIASPEVRGSTTPDYNTFCLDCHAVPVGSAAAINWNFDQHGFVNGVSNNAPPRFLSANLNPPYTLDGTSNTVEDLPTNFVLSCLDCHEPHGVADENNKYLLRTTVNGVTGIELTGAQTWYYFCRGCHTHSAHGFGPSVRCGGQGCHMHGSGKF